MHSLLENSSYFVRKLRCSSSASRYSSCVTPHLLTSPVRTDLHPTPTCTHSIFSHSFTHFLPRTATDCMRGSKTQSDSQQRSDFSLGMSLGFGHKSHRIHIFQLDPRFCPWEWRTRSGPCTRPAPPGVRCQGQPNVWPGGPLTDVPLPCHRNAHTHTLKCIHTPPCPQHSPACSIQYPPTRSNEKPHSSF